MTLQIDGQATNAIQKAMQQNQSATEDGRGVLHTPRNDRAEPSPASRETEGGIATGGSRETAPPHPSAENKTTPWELPLLIATPILGGAVVAWRCFKKK